MKFAITFFATVLLTVSSCQQSAPEKPNVLFILVDDLGYHDLGVTGSEYYETPHIDRLAAESMVFTQGYAACQVCSPSRASIMSGKSPPGTELPTGSVQKPARSGEKPGGLISYYRLRMAITCHMLTPPCLKR